MSEDIRLELLKDAVSRSGIDGQTKDVLADDLRYAQEINGTEDPALRGIKRILISGVRRELLASERIDKALKNHIAMCPGGGVPKTAKEFCLRIAAQYPLVVLIVVTMALQKYGIAWVRDVLLLFRGI